MPSYKELRELCEEERQKSENFISQVFYLSYKKRSFKQYFTSIFESYETILKDLKEAFIPHIIWQYLAHKIFKENGKIHQPKIKNALNKYLDVEGWEWAKWNMRNPWDFSFAEIESQPADDFYEMGDLLTGEVYLLHDPFTTEVLKNAHYQKWLHLVYFNGECWQAYPPSSPFISLTADDLFFFATELHPNKDFETYLDVKEDLEANPVPYRMLMYGSHMPVSYSNQNEPFIYHFSEIDVAQFNIRDLETDFYIEETDGVYRLGLKEWEAYPHFSVAYYDAVEEEVFVLTAMTERGYRAVVKTLNKYDFYLSYDPEFLVTPPMLTTAETVLGKKISLSPYEDLFKETENADHQENLNQFLSLVLPAINKGEEPNIEKAAQKAGIPVETGRELLQSIYQKMKEDQ